MSQEYLNNGTHNKKDLDKDNYYKNSGINTTEEITCDENLGYIKFKNQL